MIAVTQCGVRLYFSTISILDAQQLNSLPASDRLTENIQPDNLYLQHVRLPPGYTANATVGKPKLVHSSYYSNGTTLMVSSAQQDQDLLWSLSSEPFPLRGYLAESSTVFPLDGQVWAIAEIRSTNDDEHFNMPLKSDRNNTKIVLLTNQGAYIIALIKPMGLLVQLLTACHGPDHEAVKNYFQVQSEAQVCVASLLIACMEAYRGTEIGMWATQAFILYGGEPHLPNRNQLYNTFNGKKIFVVALHREFHCGIFALFYSDAQGSNTNIMVSTPYPMSQQRGEQMSFSARSLNERGAQQPFNQLQDIIYSPKHTGLYLYLIRLLKPIWKKKCIISPEGVSSLNYQNCSDILCELRALKAFIEEIPLNNLSGKWSMSKTKKDFINF